MTQNSVSRMTFEKQDAEKNCQRQIDENQSKSQVERGHHSSRKEAVDCVAF
jgi:hypothetical protein